MNIQLGGGLLINQAVIAAVVLDLAVILFWRRKKSGYFVNPNFSRGLSQFFAALPVHPIPGVRAAADVYRRARAAAANDWAGLPGAIQSGLLRMGIGRSAVALDQIRAAIFLLAALGLAGVPAGLVIHHRWLHQEPVRLPFDEAWYTLFINAELYLPSFFLIVLACTVGLVLLFAGRQTAGEPLSLALPDAAEPPARPLSCFTRWLMAAAWLLGLVGAACGAVQGTVYGPLFFAAWGCAGLGWLLSLVPFTRLRAFWAAYRDQLPAWVGAHVALIIFLDCLYSHQPFAWAALLGLLVLLAHLIRRRRQVPPIVWVLNLAVVLFTININQWVYAVVGDDYSFYTFALEIAQTHSFADITRNFFNGANVYGAHPYISSLMQAGVMKVLGLNNFGWRFSALYFAVLAIGLFYSFFIRFIPRRTALITAVLLAGSTYLESFGKIGYNNLQALFAMGLVLAAAGWAIGLRRPSADHIDPAGQVDPAGHIDPAAAEFAAAALGAAMGLCFYVYPAALYCLPLPIALIWIYDRPRTRRDWLHWWPTLTTLALVVLPLLLQPTYWAAKMPGLLTNNPDITQNLPTLVLHLVTNFFMAFYSFLYTTQERFYTAAAFMDPLSAVFVLIGFARLVKASRAEKFARFLLVGLVVLLALVGASHDRDYPPPTRMFLMLPWFALLAAYGLEWTVSLARQAAARPFPAGRALGLLLSAILALNLYQSYGLAPYTVQDNQSFEAVSLRLIQQIERHDREAALVPHTLLYVTNNFMGIDGLLVMQRLYQIEAVNIARLELTGPDFTAEEAARMLDPNTVVILQIDLDPGWYEAAAHRMTNEGKGRCVATTMSGAGRFEFFYPPEFEYLCPLE